MAAKSQFKGKLAETFNVEIGGGYDQFFNRLMELKENIAMQKEGFSRAGEELINIFRGHIVRNIGPGNEPWPLYAKPVLEYTVEHTSTKTGKTSTYGPYTKKWFNPGSTLLFRGGQLYDQIKMLELDQQEVSAGIRYDDCAYAGVHNFGYTVSSAELMYIKGYGEPALGKKMGVKTEVKIPQREFIWIEDADAKRVRNIISTSFDTKLRKAWNTAKKGRTLKLYSKDACDRIQSNQTKLENSGNK